MPEAVGVAASGSEQGQVVQSSQSEPARMRMRTMAEKRGDDDEEEEEADGVTSLSGAFERHAQVADSPTSPRKAQTSPSVLPTPPVDPVPRPSSRGARDQVLRNAGQAPAPHIAVAPPQAQEVVQSPVVIAPGHSLAPASTIPRFFSPPPNLAPPVDPTLRSGTPAPKAASTPSFSFSPAEAPAAPAPAQVPPPPPPPTFAFSGPDEQASTAGVPSFSFSGPEEDENGAAGPTNDTPPAISVNVCAPDEEDLPPSTTHSRSVSATSNQSHVSLHSDQGQAQRATATTTGEVAAHAHAHAHAHSPRVLRGGPIQSASSIAGLTCSSPTCGKYIAGRVLSAGPTLGYYHPPCFKCSHCHLSLEHVAFYEHEGKAYCHLDYYELWARRCFHCRTPIVDERFIKVEDEAFAGAGAKGEEGGGGGTTRYYHDLHFFCANCGDPFLDPKAAAAGAAASCKPYLVHQGYPYCSPCHERLHLPHCRGCSGVIRPEEEMLTFNPGRCKKPANKVAGRGIAAPRGDKWHERCLRCSRCGGSFADGEGQGGGSIFVNEDGEVFDGDCYAIWLRGQV